MPGLYAAAPRGMLVLCALPPYLTSSGNSHAREKANSTYITLTRFDFSGTGIPIRFAANLSGAFSIVLRQQCTVLLCIQQAIQEWSFSLMAGPLFILAGEVWEPQSSKRMLVLPGLYLATGQSWHSVSWPI